MITPHLTLDLLIDYIHGELPPDEDAVAHTHLSACASCRAELEGETALSERLRLQAREQTFDLPETLKARIRRAAQAEHTGTITRIIATGPLRIAALPVAAAILIGIFLLHPLARVPHPSIDVAFYLTAHAAQHAGDPLSEHNAVPDNETAYDENVGDVAQ